MEDHPRTRIRGSWTMDPFQIAFLWLINGGNPNYLLTGMILQASPPLDMDFTPAKNIFQGHFSITGRFWQMPASRSHQKWRAIQNQNKCNTRNIQGGEHKQTIHHNSLKATDCFKSCKENLIRCWELDVTPLWKLFDSRFTALRFPWKTWHWLMGTPKATNGIPIGSMYSIFTYMWLIFMVNVAKYTIHGSYGRITFSIQYNLFFTNKPPWCVFIFLLAKVC